MPGDVSGQVWIVIAVVATWLVVSILSIIALRMQHGSKLHDLTVKAHTLRRERLSALYKQGGAELLSEYASDAGQIMADMVLGDGDRRANPAEVGEFEDDGGDIEILEAA